ncbi:MAG: serine hydrolase [Chloroflexi bacterium]|nr:serine hydrolase [Chloroflexota bacterium]
MTEQAAETDQEGVDIRRLLLRVSIPVAVLLGVLLATGIFLLSSHGGAPASVPGDSVSAATEVVTASPSASPSPTPPPSPSPSPPPQVEEPQTGGDQPGTVVPNTYGTRPENTAGEELLGLYDILQREIDAYAVQAGGIEVGIAVTDLQTGETVSVGGNAPHKTGCVINMFALMAAVDRFQDGAASPSSVSYSVQKGIGGSFPPEVKNFLGVIFGDFRAGEAHARALMAGWGMQTYQFDHVPYYGTEPYQPNILTALETNDILARLWWGELFSPEWTDYTIGVLRNTFSYIDYILPKYLPWNATVGHKIGYHWDYDGWVNNDVGLVSFTGADGQQKAYAISYFSQYAPTEYHGYSFGARLSLIVWNFMATRYGLAPQPAPPPVPSITPTLTPTPAPETPTLTPSPTATSAPTDSSTPAPTPATITPSPKPLPPAPPPPPSASP